VSRLSNTSLLAQARALPIVEIAQALHEQEPKRLRLKHQASTWRAHCLSGHADPHPSLRLWPEGNRWHCFSCGAGGDGIELVRVALKCSFRDALAWLKARFHLSGEMRHGGSDPIAGWARIRGLKRESVLAFGVEVDGEFLRFPMRYGPGQPVVSYQKRRADNGPMTADGRRSIGEKDQSRALFFPLHWPEPDGESALLMCEGEADAIAAHSAGIVHVVGTPGTGWADEVRRALEVLREGWPGRAVLILDGDVDERELLERATMLKAEGVRVPLYVSPVPGERDLNAWLREPGGATAIRAAVLGTQAYAPIYRDATEHVLEAVRRSSGLQKRHVAPLHALVMHALLNVHPFARREFKGIEVGPGEWVWTWAELAELIGARSKKTARTLAAKLEGAGFWSIEGKDGKGVLVKVHNLSAFRKVAGWELEKEQAATMGYDDTAARRGRSKTQTGRSGKLIDLPPERREEAV